MDINANVETKLGTEHVLDLSDRLYKIMIGLIAIAAVVAVGWGLYAFQALPQNAPHEIQVTGEGKAYAKPDVAIVDLGAHTQAAKSQDAVTQNNKIMDAVISAIEKLGVDQKDIQTTSYNLQPVYDYGYVVPPTPMNGSAGAGIAYPIPPVSRQTLRGYTLDQQIEVKIRNFDSINAIMDAATSNGANTVGSLQFTIDDMEKINSEARANAIQQAKEKASSMFSAAGLGGATIVDISEGYNNYPQPLYATSAMGKDQSAPVPAANIQTGQQEADVTVTLTYRVR